MTLYLYIKLQIDSVSVQDSCVFRGFLKTVGELPLNASHNFPMHTLHLVQIQTGEHYVKKFLSHLAASTR